MEAALKTASQFATLEASVRTEYKLKRPSELLTNLIAILAVSSGGAPVVLKFKSVTNLTKEEILFLRS